VKSSILLAALLLAGCAARRVRVAVNKPDAGRALFESHCAGCHLNEGQWMRGEAPPLEGSAWASGPENHLIRIVLHGLHGPIEVAGKVYNQEMPAFAPILDDAAIASLITHLRVRFHIPAPPVAPESVRRIRAATPERRGYWTAEELLRER
jgi:mono/diheme cytochrome c family protein